MRRQTAHTLRMSETSIAAPRTRASRPARTVRPKAAEPAARAVGRQIEAGFRDATTSAVDQSLAAGIAVAVLTDRRKVAWLHPDGVVRRTREPVAKPPSK